MNPGFDFIETFLQISSSFQPFPKYRAVKHLFECMNAFVHPTNKKYSHDACYESELIRKQAS